MSLIRDESVPVFLDGHSEENAKYALSGTWVEGGAHVGVRGMDSMLRGKGTQGFREVATPPHYPVCVLITIQENILHSHSSFVTMQTPEHGGVAWSFPSPSVLGGVLAVPSSPSWWHYSTGHSHFSGSVSCFCRHSCV